MTVDWLNVFFNAIWIVGLAIILAAFSYNDWLAHASGVKLRQQLNSPTFQAPLTLGLMMVSASLALLADVWWEQVLWWAFVALFAVQWWFDRKTRNVE